MNMNLHSLSRRTIIPCVLITFGCLQIKSLQAQPKSSQDPTTFSPPNVFSTVKKIITTPNLSSCSALLLFQKDSKKNHHNSISKISSKFYTIHGDHYVINLPNSRNASNISTTTSSEPAAPVNHVNHIKRYGANCIVSLIFIQQDKLSVGPMEQLSDSRSIAEMLDFIILPRSSYPLTKRNTDFYIFIASGPKIADQILLNNHVSYRLTHKIVISTTLPFSFNNLLNDSDSGGDSHKNEDTELEIKTLCFYCNYGLPKVIDIKNIMSDSDSNYYYFPQLLNNFHTKTLHASVLTAGPSTQMRLVNGKWQPYLTGGPYLRNFLTAAETLNFTYELHRGGGSGLRAKNGSWSGVMGDVTKGKADVGIVCGITMGRYPFVQFSSVIEFLVIRIAHGPTRPIYTWKSIFWPFSNELWYFIVVIIIISLIFLNTVRLILCKQQHKYAARIQIVKKFKRKFTLTVPSSIIFIFASFLNQNYLQARAYTLRIFSAVWFFFILVITTVYLSKLFGFFVNPPTEHAPKTFTELAASNYGAGLTYFGGVLYNLFQQAKPRSSFGKIYKRIEKRKTNDCLLDTMSEERKYVCISYGASMHMEIQVKIADRYGRSRIIVEHGNAYQVPISLILEKRSILTSGFNRIVSSNFESGLTRLWRSWTYIELRKNRLEVEKMNNKSTPIVPDSQEPVQLKIQHFTGAYSILFCGLFGSLIASVVEYFCARCWKREDLIVFGISDM